MSGRSALVLSCLLVSVPVFAQPPAPPPVSGPAGAALGELAAPPVDRAAPEASAAPSPLPGFKSIFTDLGTDIRRFPSLQTGLLLGGAGLAAAVVEPKDRSISNTFAASDDLNATLRSGAVLGGTATQAGLALGTWVVGRAFHNREIAELGADLVRAQLLTQLLTQSIKLAAHRTRPDGTSWSFPSGHTSTSFATATVIQRHYGWKAGLPAYALAGYVGASRVQDRRHYLSDVVFGAALGIAAGRTVTVGRGSARFAMAPMAADGGGGIGFTWMGRK